MEKIVSQLDAEGYFAGAVVADESPLEPGVFLFPGGSIDMLPPATIRPGMRYRVIENQWVEEPVPPSENGEGGSTPVEPAGPITQFSTREYLKRFTLEEYARARRSENMEVQWALDNMIAAQFIDINDPETIAGLDLMVSEGVISASKRNDLLTPLANAN